MKLQRKERLISAPLRLNERTRREARELASKYDVRESEVYRFIIDDFFSSGRQLSVDDKTTNENA